MNFNSAHRKRGSGDRSRSTGIAMLCLLMLSIPPLEGSAEQKGKPALDTRIPFPRPGSHSANWQEVHGRSADMANIATGSTCLICHERTDCIACHAAKPPRDHTNTWRTLSHGFMADADRDRCLICHKQDYCLRCHNETAPRSHTGSWISRHCSGCHFASGVTPADSCGVCHKKAPHSSAPHSVSGQMNCALCHK